MPVITNLFEHMDSFLTKNFSDSNIYIYIYIYMRVGEIFCVNIYTHINRCISGKSKANPVQAYCRPTGFQEVEVPRYRDNRHMNE